MLVALVLALTSAAWAWGRRRDRFLALAECHRSWADRYKGIGAVAVGPADHPAYREQQRRWRMWHAHTRAADAYEAAARYPWVSDPGAPVDLPQLTEQDLRTLRMPDDTVSP